MSVKIKDISASIVLYKEDISTLTETVNCFLKIPESKTLFLIDNSPNNLFKDQFNNPNIKYISTVKNIGFGAGHNLIIEYLKNTLGYHLVLNPDVSFSSNVLTSLIIELEKNKNVAMIAPKVLFPSGEYQNSCRRYPSLTELLVRRFYLKNIFKKTIQKGIYTDRNLNQSFNPDYLTGCFHLYKTEDFIKLEGFDERYFLYMEDVDICKKIDKLGKKKLYYPKVEITHVLKQGSAKSTKLFFVHTLSAIKYFLKWGFK